MSVLTGPRDSAIVNPKLGETLNSQLSIEVSPRMSVPSQGEGSSQRHLVGSGKRTVRKTNRMLTAQVELEDLIVNAQE